ncbi:ABC transporter ATP-binding protein [Undibacterium rugosum]|uniref:ABC transporter ATP-binding protein n=1 Tax=Undibacterium rugosum TaxID=2762291 RepID=A0A923I0A2_9BURK|nr:ABC transporter ATP-binding protein [Undibacterium rugosum]MBC3935444.1 ABC transporter ATP-binding protein [Undibacterium rugosum]MBR7778781.1 ABC transporter ATP-binding protein [Undibacterium rugosum]
MSAQHPLRKLLSYASAYKTDFRLATLYSVLNKFFDVLPEVLIGVAVDIVVNGEKSFLAKRVLGGFGITETWHQLVLLGVLNAVIWMGESWFEYLLSLKWRKLAQNLQHDVRLDAYDHVQKLDMAYFENQRTGNLMSILNEDINQMERFLNGGANQIIQVICSSIMVSAVFFALQPSLAVIALLPVPAILFGAFWFQKRLAPRYAEVREAAGDVSARLNNNLLGLATIKAFATEEFEKQQIGAASNAYRNANARAIAVSSAITPVIRMAILAGFTATLVYGGWLTLHDELAVGAYSVLVYLTQRLLWPMTGLAEVADMYQRSMSAIDRAMNLLDTPIQIRYDGKALPQAQVSGDIRFEDVSFAYGEQTTLHHINLHIPAGKTVAFVGSTGSGKSTLVKLLLRFYTPASGHILLDGVASDSLNLQDLRRVIGYVAQDSFLTDGTIAENIAYGLEQVSDADIAAAARAAEAMEFIEKLPLGFATRIGERGQKLSGGQRQRLALARAILKNPPVLILDEATSAVDNETEAAIQRSLDVVSKNRTTIVIAHRLSTVRQADCIHVMEAGRIVESGSHEQLLAYNGSYAALWRLQTGER